MTVTYFVNGKEVPKEELKNVEITNKDYIQYYESIRQEVIKQMQAAEEIKDKAG